MEQAIDREIAEQDDYGVEYDSSFILSNPIPAYCKKCKRRFEDGPQWKDAIRSPSLENCRCFYCGGHLRPIDKAAYAERLRCLHLYRVPVQCFLFMSSMEPEESPSLAQ